MIPDSVKISLLEVTRMIADCKLADNARAKATHERFNVFTTLLKAEDEVRLHTRFLHCLLDPNGEHDCGTLFLDLFFETLNQCEGVDHNNYPISFEIPQKNVAWAVSKEASRAGYGQMDILLESTMYGIAIENKIRAYDQEMQLSSYSSYLEKTSKIITLVIYLTLDGKPSSSAAGKNYCRISYADHILLWLEKCLRETYRIVPINQVLLQYREVVRQLTNQTIDAKNMEPIIKFISDNPDLVRFRTVIADAIEEAIENTWEIIEKEIITGLPEGFEVCLNNRAIGKGRFGGGSFNSLLVVPPQTCILQNSPFEIWVEQDDVDLGVGAVLIGDCNNAVSFDNALIEKMLKNTPTDENPTQRFPLGWMNLIPGVSDEKFASVVKNPDCGAIIEKIVFYCEKLENAYSAAIIDTDGSYVIDNAPKKI